MAKDELLTVDEVAKQLKVNTTTVYRLARRGKIPAFKVGDQWRFSHDMLNSWMADKVKMYLVKAEDANGHDK